MIYLLRHGDAEAGDGHDAARRLTPKGERQAHAVGRALVALGAEIDTCTASPRVRAAETARLACEALGIEPDLSRALARLTGGKARMRKGGLAVVDGSTLVALLRPADMAAIAR